MTGNRITKAYDIVGKGDEERQADDVYSIPGKAKKRGEFAK
jgi:hypothetical protein